MTNDGVMDIVIGTAGHGRLLSRQRGRLAVEYAGRYAVDALSRRRLEKLRERSASGRSRVDTAGDFRILDERRRVSRLAAGINQQRSAAAPVLLFRDAPTPSISAAGLLRVNVTQRKLFNVFVAKRAVIRDNDQRQACGGVLAIQLRPLRAELRDRSRTLHHQRSRQRHSRRGKAFRQPQIARHVRREFTDWVSHRGNHQLRSLIQAIA